METLRVFVKIGAIERDNVGERVYVVGVQEEEMLA